MCTVRRWTSGRVSGAPPANQTDAVVVDAPETEREVAVEVAGAAPIERVTVGKNTEDWRALEGTDDPGAGLDAYTVAGEWTDDAPVSGMSWDEGRGTDGDVYTVRVRQATADRFPGMAWVGPIWVEPR